MTRRDWDWDAEARRFGVSRDGRLNAAAAAVEHPRALVWRHADGSAEEVSGPELRRLGRRAAAALGRGGVRRGDRVAVLLGRRPESFAVPLGLWQIGAVVVPLFSGFGPAALRTRLDDSGATAAVVDVANRTGLDGLDAELGLAVFSVDGGGDDLPLDVREGDEERSLADTRADAAATIMYTSGTTGRPKGCVIPHRGALTMWPFVRHCFGIGTGDLLFSTADTGWSFGLYTSGFSVLTSGCARLVYEGPFDPAAWWTAVRELGVTHLAGAPTGFRQLGLAGLEATGGPLPTLRGGTAVGEPLDADVIAWFRERLGIAIHDGYGLSELGMVTGNLRPGEPVPGSMGVPLPGFDVRLVDDDGEDVAEGETGRVAVLDNGYLLSTTYWGRDDEWRARLRDGWWLTEDLARRDEAGRYWYVSRADDVIVTAGYNVGPFEVESALLEHPLVADAACVAEPDARKGHVPVAHVVLAAAEPGDLAEQLKRWVGERVGWHASPRRVYVHAELPRTESGKVRRAQLRAGAGAPS